MNPDFIPVPAGLFWSFLVAAFGLLGLFIRRELSTKELRSVVKDASEKVPELVRTRAEERGVDSMLPPPSKAPRRRLDTFNSVRELRAALDESVRLENTRVRAVNLPSERPFERTPESEQPTNPEPSLQRARARESGEHVPHLGFPEDRETPTDPSAVEPKR